MHTQIYNHQYRTFCIVLIKLPLHISYVRDSFVNRYENVLILIQEFKQIGKLLQKKDFKTLRGLLVKSRFKKLVIFPSIAYTIQRFTLLYYYFSRLENSIGLMKQFFQVNMSILCVMYLFISQLLVELRRKRKQNDSKIFFPCGGVACVLK